MRNLSLLAGAMLVSAVPAFAQINTFTYANGDCGFFHLTGTGATSRGALAGAAGEIMARVDREEYRGWGDIQAAGGAQISGCVTIIQDQDGATPENGNIWFYNESTTQPDFPTIPAGQAPGTTAAGGVGPIAGPTFNAGPTAGFYRLNFNTPVLLANDVGDSFWSFEVGAAPLWTADGLSIQIALGVAVTGFTFFDIAGPAPIAQTTYGAIHNPGTATIGYGGVRQVAVDFRTLGNGAGCGTAITNQASHPISNAAPGTGSFMSGLHPDWRNPPANPGRVDDVGYVALLPNLTTGSLVVYCVDFGFGTPALPLSAFVPGSTGILSLTPGFSVAGVAISSAANTPFNIIIPATAAVRGNLGAGFALYSQCIGLDAASGTLQGSPGVKQAF